MPTEFFVGVLEVNNITTDTAVVFQQSVFKLSAQEITLRLSVIHQNFFLSKNCPKNRYEK